MTGKRSYTNKFARYVVDLSRIGTIKDVALFLNVSWDTVKDIQKRYLQRHYGNPDLSKLEYIGIDEFAVRKGHVYKTIVADLQTGQVVYVGEGKSASALDKFWKKIRKAGRDKGCGYRPLCRLHIIRKGECAECDARF